MESKKVKEREGGGARRTVKMQNHFDFSIACTDIRIQNISAEIMSLKEKKKLMKKV